MAWGINHGYLDEKAYLPAVIKTWQGLVSCVHFDGKLGYVQPVGADPHLVNADQTEIYGVGAFLLAGSEVYKIAIRNRAAVKKLIAINPLLDFRDNEIINLDWQDLQNTVPGLTKDNVAIYDFQSNRLQVTQIVKDGQHIELLFQTDFAPGGKKNFWVMCQPAGLEKPISRYTTYCRFVPERKDDFAWENDKVAFRMYGPALESETITSGIDTWVKCVPYPIIDKFYKSADYHTNHGEGGDFYKVGNSLGCGGMAPFVNGKICLPRNFNNWKVITNGPIRSIFELTYMPWAIDSHIVSETKRISIDLGSNLNRIECRYSCQDIKTLPVAAGIVLSGTSKQTWNTNQIIAYWLPTDGHDYGMMGCGVFLGSKSDTEIVNAENHLLLLLHHKIDAPVVYYAGSCWDKIPTFDSFGKWQQYLTNFKDRIDHPVVITVKE